MDFFQHIEEDLRTISHETRKKHPIVKEAAEKAIVGLGSMKEAYAQAVRLKQAPGPGHPLFQSHETLRPFLLACNHIQASSKAIMTSLSATQRLVSWNALRLQEDTGFIVRVLAIQAEGNHSADVQLKVLQTLLIVMRTHAENCPIEEDIFSQALWICFHLQEFQSANTRTASAVRNIASATVRQIALMVFEVQQLHASVDSSTSLEDIQTPEALTQTLRSAYYSFQDYSRIVRCESPQWLKRNVNVSVELGLELIEAILAQFSNLFKSVPAFTAILREQTCPSILSLLATCIPTSNSSGSTLMVGEPTSSTAACTFPRLVRIMRLSSTLLSSFCCCLEPQMEAVLSALLDIMSSNIVEDIPGRMYQGGSTDGVQYLNLKPTNYVDWPVLLSMEVLSRFCKNTKMVTAVYLSHDGAHLQSLIADAGTSSRRSLRGKSRLYGSLCRGLSKFVGSCSHDDYQNPSPNSRPLCGLEMLSDDVVQSQPKFVALRAAVSSLARLVSMLEELIPAENKDTDERIVNLHIYHIQTMIRILVVPMLEAFSSTLSLCEDEDVLGFVVKGLQSLAKTSGNKRVHLFEIRDACISTISKHVLPSHPLDRINHRHILVLDSLITTAILLGSQFNFPWKLILQSFEVLHNVVRERSKTLTNEGEIVEGLKRIEKRISKFAMSSTIKMDEKTLDCIMVALSDLTLDLLSIPVTAYSKRYQRDIQKQIQAERKGVATSGSSCRKLPDSLAKTLANADAIANAASASLGEEEDSISNELKKLDDNPLSVFYTSASDISDPKNSILGTYMRHFVSEKPSYLLRMLIEVATANLLRATPSFWELLSEQLILTCTCDDQNVRGFSCDSLITLIETVIASSSTNGGNFPICPSKLLSPLNKIVFSSNIDCCEKVLQGVFDLLQSHGHLLGNSWPVLLEILQNVAVASTLSDESEVQDDRTGIAVASGAAASTGMTSGAGAVGGGQNQPVHFAFRTLQLILDDYLDTFTVESLEHSMLPCLGKFASQNVDVNISLTAVNTLWSLSDFIQSKTAEGQAQNLTIWSTLFQQFSRIASDRRPEVRNCALNTFFSTVATHGSNFSDDLWHLCLFKNMFPLCDTLISFSGGKSTESFASGDAPQHRLGDRPVVVLHHSRNTLSKQWNETIVLMLQGMSRVFRTFADALVSLRHFAEAWEKVLCLTVSITLEKPRTRIEVAVAGIYTFQELLLIASYQGPQLSSSRVGAGMRVVDGALVSVKSADSGVKKPAIKDNPHNPQYWRCAFSQLDQVCRKLLSEIPTTTETTDEKDLAKAFISCLVGVYQNCREQEFADLTNIDRLLGLLRMILENHTFVLNPTSNLPIVGIHTDVFKAYRACAPYVNGKVYTGLFQQLLGYISISSSVTPDANARKCRFSPYFIRDVFETMSSLFDNGVPALTRYENICPWLDCIRVFFYDRSSAAGCLQQIQRIEKKYPHLGDNDVRVTCSLWKNATGVLLKLIRFGLPAVVGLPEECSNESTTHVWEAVFDVVEFFLMSGNNERGASEGKTTQPEEDDELCVSVLDTLVLVMRDIAQSDQNTHPVPSVAQRRLVQLLSIGSSSNSGSSKRFSSSCVNHLSILCNAPANHEEQSLHLGALAQTVFLTCCEDALGELSSGDPERISQQAFAVLEKMHDLRILSTLPRIVGSSNDGRFRLLRIFNGLCDCIKSSDVHVRDLVHKLLRHSGLIELTLSAVEENQKLRHQLKEGR